MKKKKTDPSFQMLFRSEMMAKAFLQACDKADLSAADVAMTLATILLSLGGHAECPPDQPCMLDDPRLRELSDQVARVLNENQATTHEALLIYGGMLGGMAQAIAERNVSKEGEFQQVVLQ